MASTHLRRKRFESSVLFNITRASAKGGRAVQFKQHTHTQVRQSGTIHVHTCSHTCYTGQPMHTPGMTWSAYRSCPPREVEEWGGGRWGRVTLEAGCQSVCRGDTLHVTSRAWYAVVTYHCRGSSQPWRTTWLQSSFWLQTHAKSFLPYLHIYCCWTISSVILYVHTDINVQTFPLLTPKIITSCHCMMFYSKCLQCTVQQQHSN